MADKNNEDEADAKGGSFSQADRSSSNDMENICLIIRDNVPIRVKIEERMKQLKAEIRARQAANAKSAG